jgi:hypothetical protein
MPRQTSIQLTDATDRQIGSLKLAGFGTTTDIIRIAIDRMFRDEAAKAPKRHIEIWQHRGSGEQYAMLIELGRPISANGPLHHKEAAEIVAGSDDLDWSDELADYINTEDEAADERAYRLVWPQIGE